MSAICYFRISVTSAPEFNIIETKVMHVFIGVCWLLRGRINWNRSNRGASFAFNYPLPGAWGLSFLSSSLNGVEQDCRDIAAFGEEFCSRTGIGSPLTMLGPYWGRRWIWLVDLRKLLLVDIYWLVVKITTPAANFIVSTLHLFPHNLPMFNVRNQGTTVLKIAILQPYDKDETLYISLYDLILMSSLFITDIHSALENCCELEIYCVELCQFSSFFIEQ